MFTDYYELLEIDLTNDQLIIRNAYKKQAILWHPDKNKSQNTTIKMQQINEAYIILKDINAKSLYDVEYIRYIKTKKEHEIITVIKNEHKNNFEKTNSNCENPNSFNFNIEDDLLINLINNAKQKAHELIEETKNDFITLTKAFLKGFIERKF